MISGTRRGLNKRQWLLLQLQSVLLFSISLLGVGEASQAFKKIAVFFLVHSVPAADLEYSRDAKIHSDTPTSFLATESSLSNRDPTCALRTVSSVFLGGNTPDYRNWYSGSLENYFWVILVDNSTGLKYVIIGAREMVEQPIALVLAGSIPNTYLHSSSQLSVTPVPGNLMPLSELGALGTHVVQRHTCEQKHTYTLNKSKK